MKKLFLLISMGAFILSASAQQNSSMMVQNAKISGTDPTNTLHKIPVLQQDAHQHSGNKTTNVNSGWFNYLRQLWGSQVGYYYSNTYQDSTLYDNTPGLFSPGYMFLWGFGVSLDPTDSAFNYGFGPSGSTLNFAITNNDSYEVDSIYLNGKYMRNENYTDSLILDVVIANTGTISHTPNGSVSYIYDNGTYLADPHPGSWLNSNGEQYMYAISGDGSARFANADYDAANNQFATTVTATTQRYAMALDAAIADTDATNDGGKFQYTMNPPLLVPAGAKVIAYAHFKSGHTYPAGTTVDDANYFRFYSGDPIDGYFPPQSAHNDAIGYPGSYQAGLLGDTYAAYAPPNWIPGKRMLVPNMQFAGPTGLDAPDFGFFITCNACASLGVPDVKNIISSSAYPNPANTELFIPFTLNTPADITVTLTNTLGQVVRSQDIHNVTTGKASFNTGDLVEGIYFFTINGGGQSASGRVVVEH